MKKIILITLCLCALLCVLTAVTDQPQKFPVPIEIKQTFPYIENDILYTEKRQIPLAWITDITIDNRTVKYAIITWTDGKYHGGIFTMQMWELEKIRPQWEQYYAKKNR